MRLRLPLFLGTSVLMTVVVVIGGAVAGLAAEIIIGNVAGILGIISAGTAETAFNEDAFLNNL